jgi:hypothetical protein
VKFYLGSHRPHWLGLTDVPLMVSNRTLRNRRTLPRARGPWVLDSGAFSEVATYGGFTTSPGDYVLAVHRYQAEIGQLAWAAPQDWMCEPFILAKTGMTVSEHQRRTVTGYLDLRDRAPDLPFIPVLQGWTLDDYRRHVDAYDRAGVDLTTVPLIGLGSVCRRQHTATIAAIVATLQGLRLHGFGVKTEGLSRYSYGLTSADSMAWSFDARHARPLRGCPHRSCANCLRYALWWRRQVLTRCHGAEQLAFPDEVSA